MSASFAPASNNAGGGAAGVAGAGVSGMNMQPGVVRASPVVIARGGVLCDPRSWFVVFEIAFVTSARF